MKRRHLFLGLLGLFGLARRADAQVSVGSGRGPSGVRLSGNEYRFDTATGSVAATRLGIYTEGMTEPDGVQHSGAFWAYVYGPASDLKCEVKFNIAGNVLTVARGKWTLPQS